MGTRNELVPNRREAADIAAGLLLNFLAPQQVTGFAAGRIRNR